MFNNLTVLETLTYSALLRLPANMSLEKKQARVNTIIQRLGLSECQNTRIQGISGGERKRTAIGIELVTDPSILFLDEPTSGLDAFNAFNVIESIKKVTVQESKIVLMTIHQPRTDILELFDKILLLSRGQTVFFGSTQGIYGNL